jgi:hypothetical protein
MGPDHDRDSCRQSLWFYQATVFRQGIINLKGKTTTATKKNRHYQPFTPLFRLNDQPEPNNLGDSSGVSVLAVAGGGLEDSCAQEQDEIGSGESQEIFLHHLYNT